MSKSNTYSLLLRSLGRITFALAFILMPAFVLAQGTATAPKAPATKADAKADAKTDTKGDAKKSTTTPDDAAKSDSKSSMKFEVYQDASKEYRWRLVTGADKDRQTLATGGQGYKAKADCINGVKALTERIDKLTFETYEDNAKQYRWRAKATNGQVMASSSSSFKTKDDCDKAVETIKKGAPKATVEEVKDAKG